MLAAPHLNGLKAGCQRLMFVKLCQIQHRHIRGLQRQGSQLFFAACLCDLQLNAQDSAKARIGDHCLLVII